MFEKYFMSTVRYILYPKGMNMGELFRMGRCSWLQQPNKGQLCRKVGCAVGMNDF